MRHAYATLEDLGLHPLFRIETNRETWLALHNETTIAELAFDDSTYIFEPDETLQVLQIEVELAKSADTQVLHDLHRVFTEEYHLSSTHDSKFDRGWAYVCATQREEKVEAKLTLDSQDSARIANWLRQDVAHVSGYTIRREEFTNNILDQYFDTSDYKLAKNGYYLRLRKQGSSHRLTLRQLADRIEGGLSNQGEIKSRDQEQNFGDSLLAIEGHVSRLTASKRAIPLDVSLPIEDRLKKLGLEPSIKISIERTIWIVTPADDKIPGNATNPERIAKIKFDQIKAYCDGRTPLEYSEIELTGIEDSPSSPREFRVDQFGVFITSFLTACGDYLKKPNIMARGDAKYFYILRQLGLIGENEGPVGGASSLIRGRARDPEIEMRTRTYHSLIPFFIVTASLASIPYTKYLSAPYSVVLAALAVLLVGIGSAIIYMFGERWSISLGARNLIVLLAAVLLVVVLFGRDGLGITSNVLSLIGFPLTVISILGIDVRRASKAR